MNNEPEFKLTKYSHGAGCGCKIAPQMLDTILHSQLAAADDDRLLVGNSSRDDAAVYDLGNGTALISTTDFFMPIVDDPFAFGKIASANAISDVYAMGGRPILAIAILGWPIEKLPPEVAKRVIEGARDTCAEAGIVLAGGHSIDNPEPIFGLAVNGIVDIKNIKKNSSAQVGDVLLLTKPLGMGILSTAQKRNVLTDEDLSPMLKQLMTLNKTGEQLGGIDAVHAMTDVTGFGLLGHLSEVSDGSGLTARINFDRVPIIPAARKYRGNGAIPGGTKRNWASYGSRIHFHSVADEQEAIDLLADPQTNGGLLISVAKTDVKSVQDLLSRHNIIAEPIGEMIARENHSVIVTR